MNNLLTSLNVVMPMFIMIGIGYYLKQKNFFEDITLKQMNKVVFTVLLSTSLYKSIINSDLSEFPRFKFFIFIAVSYLISVFVAVIIAYKTAKKDDQKGVIAQAIFRSNLVIFALPIFELIFRNESSAILTSLLAILVPTSNIVSTVVLELNRREKTKAIKLFVKVVSNPFVIATILGLCTLFLNIRPTGFINTAINQIAASANPIGLIILGASIEVKSIKDNLNILTVITVLKMIIYPVLVIAVGFMIGLSSKELVTAMLLFATPTAMSSYAVAVEMGGDGNLAGQIVMLTTIVSAFTMVGYIYFFTAAGLI